MVLNGVTLHLGKKQRCTGSKAQPYRPQEGHKPERWHQGAQRSIGKSSRIYNEERVFKMVPGPPTHTHALTHESAGRSPRSPLLKGLNRQAHRAKVKRAKIGEIFLDSHPCVPPHVSNPYAHGASCNQPWTLPQRRSLGTWAGEGLWLCTSTFALTALLAPGNADSINRDNKGHVFIYPLI